MTRLAAPRPASPVCRWCGGAHSMEHCRIVQRALFEDSKPECTRCGAEIDHLARTRLCRACMAQRKMELAENKPVKNGAQVGRGEYYVVYAPPGSDYKPGARLVAAEQAAEAGVLENGMMLRRQVREGRKSRALYYVVKPADGAQQRLVSACGPNWLRKKHRNIAQQNSQ